jgi:hypothetical protein
MYQIPARWDCGLCGGVGSQPSHRVEPPCPATTAGSLAVSYPIRSLRLALPGAERMNEDGETTRREMKLELAMVLDLVRKALVAVDLAAIGSVPA